MRSVAHCHWKGKAPLQLKWEGLIAIEGGKGAIANSIIFIIHYEILYDIVM